MNENYREGEIHFDFETSDIDIIINQDKTNGVLLRFLRSGTIVLEEHAKIDNLFSENDYAPILFDYEEIIK